MKKAIKIILCILFITLLISLGLTLANHMHKEDMLEYIATFDRVEYRDQLTPEYDGWGVPYFTTDRDFKILHLTDAHITGGVLGANEDKKALNAMAAMISAEKPDLVVITGDISFAVPWTGTINNLHAHDYVKALMERLGVYWTVTFGNHDAETFNFYNRERVSDFYEDESLKYCLFNSDDGGVYGEGNHVINVKDSRGLITQSIIMMDTNAYTNDDPLGIWWVYDNIHADQIEWYRGIVNRYSAYNRATLDSMPESERPDNTEAFTTVRSMLFVHIPLLESRRAYLEYLDAGMQNTEDVEYISGTVGEDEPYVYSSEIEEEMFETMLALGSTKAMFYGHDHLNSIVMKYKGITLSYGYSVDYFAYSDIDKIGSQRGCAVITLSPDASFEITHENYYQDKYQPLYEKEQVDMN